MKTAQVATPTFVDPQGRTVPNVRRIDDWDARPVQHGVTSFDFAHIDGRWWIVRIP